MKKKNMIILACLLAAATVCMVGANLIQTAGGKIKITDGVIDTGKGMMTYKLYTPVTATKEDPAPGVLLLHGYQNDHETNDAYAIELARRGAVVMCLDEYGHGSTGIGLKARGYVNRVVKVNYGNESREKGTLKDIGGSVRYRVLMNFSNLSFFNDMYTKDDKGNEITDSSCGGIAAYGVLATMDNVDKTRLALSGHSMGTWSSWSVAAFYSGYGEYKPKAIVLQCGELFRNSIYDPSITFINVLLLQAKYDEFSYFRDYELNVTDELLKAPLRYEFLGTDPENAKWNTTYGDFADGTARRIELLHTNHRLTTHNHAGLKTAIEWLGSSIGLKQDISSTDQIFGYKEILVLISMLLVLSCMFPLFNLLKETKFFGKVLNELPEKETMPGKKGLIRGVLITILISGLTFPFMTQLGHALLPLPEGIFRMTVGNGFLGWYLLLIIVMVITTMISLKKAKKRGEPMGGLDIGLAGDNEEKLIDFKLLLRSLVLALILTGTIYIVNYAYTKIFDLDLRYIWPFFRVFTLERFLQFLVYIPFFSLFYILNNSKIMGGMRVKSTYEPGIRGFLKNWLFNFLVMVGGVLLITLVEYIPFFAGIGPGADVLFGSTFGGPFMSILILFLPQVMFFSIPCTYFYRKTGNVYTGAFTVAILACWIVTGGSAIL